MLAQRGCEGYLSGIQHRRTEHRPGGRFRQQYSEDAITVTADDALALQQLGQAMRAAGQSIGMILDVNRAGTGPGCRWGRSGETVSIDQQHSRN